MTNSALADQPPQCAAGYPACQPVFIHEEILLSDLIPRLKSGQYQYIEQKLHDANQLAINELRHETSQDKHEKNYLNFFEFEVDQICDSGPQGLALLQAWQEAMPESGYVYAIEAQYWFNWAYRYRGTDTIDRVSESMWLAAQACASRMYVAGLKALERDPSLWIVPATIIQSIGAFNEPEWLQQLIAKGQLLHSEIQYELPKNPASLASMKAMLQDSGLDLSQPLHCPTTRPAALISPLVDRKLLDDKEYWLHASLAINPRQFQLFRRYINFLLPRWGGSHERIRALISSPLCQHMSDIERSRLEHEIWRDDFYGSYADKDSEPADFGHWLKQAKKQMTSALFPFHRQEAAMWIVVSLSNRDKMTEALPYAKIALEQAQISDNDHIVALLNITFKHPEFTPGFVEAVKQSALSRETIAARILYALFCDQGLHGFERNPAIAGQWFKDAQQAEPQDRVWGEIISAFTEAKDYLPAALLAQKGHELNNDSASFQLAYLYDEGLGVKQDSEQAIELYQKLTDSCQLEAQSNLFVIFRQRLNACRTKDERHAMEKKTLDAIIRVEQLGSDNASYTLHRLCSALQTPEIIAQMLPRLQEEATQGVPEAMAALAAIFGSKKKGHYHYRNSVLWLMACEACDPENPLLEDVKETVFENSFFGRIKLAWVQAGIEPHQLPGADNNMV